MIRNAIKHSKTANKRREYEKLYVQEKNKAGKLVKLSLDEMIKDKLKLK